jgi:hypothetical protein
LKLIELDLARSIGDVEDPNIIFNSILMSKEQFEVNLDSLKTASTKNFKNMKEYSKTKVESWLVSYANIYEEIEDTLHQFQWNLNIYKIIYFILK